VRKIGTDGQVVTLAGSAFKTGSVDGIGAAARFSTLGALNADAAGNVVVADAGNALVRRIAADGTVTTIAGTAGVHGIVDGAGSAAGFQFVQGITRDSAGNVYVTDASTIRKITPTGVVSTMAGSAKEAGAVDGTGSAARFVYPSAIAADAGGNLYVADGSAVRKISPAGQVTTIAGKVDESGFVDGIGTNARFAILTGLVVDAGGNVYVSDGSNYAVRKIAPDGTVSTVIKVPAVPGVQVYPGFQSIALGNANTLYVTQSGAVLKLTLGAK
jgi:sugar lactone lactonase YvrE